MKIMKTKKTIRFKKINETYQISMNNILEM